jgi:hypothetical protein
MGIMNIFKVTGAVVLLHGTIYTVLGHYTEQNLRCIEMPNFQAWPQKSIPMDDSLIEKLRADKNQSRTYSTSIFKTEYKTGIHTILLMHDTDTFFTVSQDNLEGLNVIVTHPKSIADYLISLENAKLDFSKFSEIIIKFSDQVAQDAQNVDLVKYITNFLADYSQKSLENQTSLRPDCFFCFDLQNTKLTDIDDFEIGQLNHKYSCTFILQDNKEYSFQSNIETVQDCAGLHNGLL